MNAGCAPGWILRHHVEDQVAHLLAYRSSAHYSDFPLRRESAEAPASQSKPTGTPKGIPVRERVFDKIGWLELQCRQLHHVSTIDIAVTLTHTATVLSATSLRIFAQPEHCYSPESCGRESATVVRVFRTLSPNPGIERSGCPAQAVHWRAPVTRNATEEDLARLYQRPQGSSRRAQCEPLQRQLLALCDESEGPARRMVHDFPPRRMSPRVTSYVTHSWS